MPSEVAKCVLSWKDKANTVQRKKKGSLYSTVLEFLNCIVVNNMIQELRAPYILFDCIILTKEQELFWILRLFFIEI